MSVSDFALQTAQVLRLNNWLLRLGQLRPGLRSFIECVDPVEMIAIPGTILSDLRNKQSRIRNE